MTAKNKQDDVVDDSTQARSKPAQAAIDAAKTETKNVGKHIELARAARVKAAKNKK